MLKSILSAAIMLLLTAPLWAQHTLVLKSGEAMKGELVSISNGKVTFKFKGNNMNFNTAEVSVIYFEENMKTGGTTGTGAATKAAAKTQDANAKSGYSYAVPGRKLVKEPVINNLTQDHGRVVVDITVDKYGNVIKAEAGAPGTTTTNNYLLIKAKQAAESVKFDTSPTMPLETKGTVTIDL